MNKRVKSIKNNKIIILFLKNSYLEKDKLEIKI